jgi:hypothetical protein
MKNHKILMEKDMKTLKGISLGDMYKKSECLYPQEITGYYQSIHPVVVVVCVIRTDQLRNLGYINRLIFLSGSGFQSDNSPPFP